MTGRALCRGGLEYRHRFSLDHLHVLMASTALYGAVFARKRKPRSSVVIEPRRNPLGGGVAVSTGRDSVGPGELPEVNLLMASLAFAGGGLEVHFL